MVLLLLQASRRLLATVLLPGVLLLSLLQLVLYNWLFLSCVFYAFNFGSACTLNHGWNCIEETPNKEQHGAAAHISCLASSAVEEMTAAQVGLLSVEMAQKMPKTYRVKRSAQESASLTAQLPV